ncbi:MAG: hypothetical protein WAL55_02800, partial [Candidatus Acidiferrales bacterium]
RLGESRGRSKQRPYESEKHEMPNVSLRKKSRKRDMSYKALRKLQRRKASRQPAKGAGGT